MKERGTVTGQEIVDASFFIDLKGWPANDNEVWMRFIRDIKLIVHNYILSKIVYMPIFSNKHQHFLEVNGLSCIITHYKSRVTSKRHVAEATCVVCLS